MSETKAPYDSGAAPAPAATCPTLDDPALLEILADIEHERWSGWEEYRGEKENRVHPSGELYVTRWERQAKTPYANLTEAEKESDRIEARKGLAAIKAYLAAHQVPAGPLTAVERAALEAAKEYDLSMEMFAIAQSDGDKETRLVARENVTEAKRAFRQAMANLAARAAAETGT